MMTPRPSLVLALAGALTVGLTGCGSDSGGDDTALSPLAAEGRELLGDRGCAACHGRNGEGAVGPALAGIYGSEVELDDGTTVVADDAYLAESITDPQAKQVDGYGIKMPVNDLDDDQIAAVIAFIRETTDGAGSSDTAAGELSGLAADGREIANTNGCGACHGADGQGGLAAPFVDLLGSQIELDDGTVVTVDEAYLRRAITDPGADRNAAYALEMPANDLSDDEVDAVVAYITALSGASAG